MLVEVDKVETLTTPRKHDINTIIDAIKLRTTTTILRQEVVDYIIQSVGNRIKCLRSARSMTGYVFLVFEEELAVQRLVQACHMEGDRYYLFVSSPTMRDKPVQVRENAI